MEDYIKIIKNTMVLAGIDKRNELLAEIDKDANLITNDSSLLRQEKANRYADKMREAMKIEELDIAGFMVKDEPEDNSSKTIDCYLRREIRAVHPSGIRVDARGKLYVDTGRMLVYSGSTVANDVHTNESYRKTLEKMRATVPTESTGKDGIDRLTEDYNFKSPSAASGFVTGMTSNGWTEWKDADGNTIDKYRMNEKNG
jgi:hypothetical protein